MNKKHIKSNNIQQNIKTLNKNKLRPQTRVYLLFNKVSGNCNIIFKKIKTFHISILHTLLGLFSQLKQFFNQIIVLITQIIYRSTQHSFCRSSNKAKHMRVAATTDVSMIVTELRQAQVNEPESRWKSYALRAGIIVSFILNIVITYWVMFKKNQPFAKVYFIYITPASIFFKIWPIIYTTIFISVIHNMWKNVWKTKSTLIYIISNILLIISSSIWEVRNVASIAVSGFVLASVDNATIYFWRVLMDEHLASKNQQIIQLSNVSQVSVQNPARPIVLKKRACPTRYTQLQLFLVRNVFSLYIGWVSVTGTVIVGLTVVYLLGFTLCQQFIIFWITSPLAAIGIYLFMAGKQEGEYKYCLGYILAVLWGFIGAGLASVQNITKQGYC